MSSVMSHSYSTLGLWNAQFSHGFFIWIIPPIKYLQMFFSSFNTGITNTNGIATVTVSVNANTVFTCSYSNVTDTCTVEFSGYLFEDGGVTGNYNSNYTKSNTGVTATVSSTGTTVTSSVYSDSFYIENALISGDFLAEFTVVAINVYGGIAFLNANKQHQWNIEYDLWNNAGLKYGNTVLTSDTSMNHKIGIKRVGSTVTFCMDDVQIGSSYTVTSADGYLGWKTHRDASRSITFKDFTIKEL